MTPTEKKYSQHIGKLYLTRNRRYNTEKEKFENHHSLIMIYGIRRRGYNEKTGYFVYNVNTISSVDFEWKKDYSVRCTDIHRGSSASSYWYATEYIPLTDENKHLIDTIVECEEKPSF